MSVFNNEKTIGASIESILSQTFRDFELIICDDGSSDNSSSIIKEYCKKDSRIVFIQNPHNMGLSFSLNKCIEASKSFFCARMDGDDLCDENRLKIEYEFLTNHPEYAFVSTSMKKFDEKGFYSVPSSREPYSPTIDDCVKGSPFCHASILIRKNAYERVGGYRDLKKTKGVEDYDLWLRLYAVGLYGCIIRQPLYSMYDGRDANHRRTFKRRLNEAWVRHDGYKRLRINIFKRIYVLKPIIIGLIPKCLYARFKKRHSSKA